MPGLDRPFAKLYYLSGDHHNEDAIKKAIGGVGKTCGGCHDDFKKD